MSRNKPTLEEIKLLIQKEMGLRDELYDITRKVTFYTQRVSELQTDVEAIGEGMTEAQATAYATDAVSTS